ncbi:MAG TPA: CPBP family intramembrane glutamic endopeptidase [Candidatus Acidoferrum sp.]|nr:CPBP family intramembrane glutamic endopeptidase [Candidatus Acidoferrum sp.]
MARYAWQVLVIVVVLGTILIAPTWETLFAATVAVILNHVGRPDWRVDFGLRPIPWKHLLFTVLGGIALFFAVKLCLQPLCDLITHSTRNLHSFDRIRGQPRTATLLILKTMLLAGLCEEVIFRGTVQKRMLLLFERVPGRTVLTIIVASAIFTSFHWYQGPSGLLLVGVLALIDCSVYAATKYTLTYTVILHLVYDTLALAAIALNYDMILQRWALRLLRLS